ncbi:MAG: ABC transporter permease [Nostocoides sp.]
MSVNPGWPIAFALVLLLALTLVAYAFGRFPNPSGPAIAAARSLVQLGAAALVITAVIRSLWASCALVAVMFAVAVYTTSARVGARRSWPYAAAAMAAGLTPVLLVVFGTGTVPFAGISIIPVAGILIGNAMTAHTLVGRRVFQAIDAERDEVEAALSIGLTRPAALSLVVHPYVPEALIPGLDQVRTAGMVTLPGAFIGVLLGGGSPVQAGAAQVLVLFGIMATQTVTAVVQERFVARSLMMPVALRASLPPG